MEVPLGCPLPAVLPAVSRSVRRFVTRSDPQSPSVFPTNAGFLGDFAESGTGSATGREPEPATVDAPPGRPIEPDRRRYAEQLYGEIAVDDPIPLRGRCPGHVTSIDSRRCRPSAGGTAPGTPRERRRGWTRSRASGFTTVAGSRRPDRRGRFPVPRDPRAASRGATAQRRGRAEAGPHAAGKRQRKDRAGIITTCPSVRGQAGRAPSALCARRRGVAGPPRAGAHQPRSAASSLRRGRCTSGAPSPGGGLGPSSSEASVNSTSILRAARPRARSSPCRAAPDGGSPNPTSVTTAHVIDVPGECRRRSARSAGWLRPNLPFLVGSMKRERSMRPTSRSAAASSFWRADTRRACAGAGRSRIARDERVAEDPRLGQPPVEVGD